MTKTHVDLFSGIGGFSLAARWAGFRTLAMVEKDDFCRAVLAKNFPGIPIFDDINTFDSKPFRGRCSVVSGGFPCQDLSDAGKGKGLDGDRSGLWFRMLDVVRTVRPCYVLAENVRGILSKPGLDGQSAIDTVLSGLDEAGYEGRAFVLGAWAVGAPHRRERVFIVGERRDMADPGHDEPSGRDAEARLCVRTAQRLPASRDGGRIMGDSNRSGQDGRGQSGATRRREPADAGSLAYSDCEREQQSGGHIGKGRRWTGNSGQGLAVSPRDEDDIGFAAEVPSAAGGGRSGDSLSRLCGSDGMADSDDAGRGEQRRTVSGAEELRSSELLRGRVAESGMGSHADGVSSRLVGTLWPAGRGCAQREDEPPRLCEPGGIKGRQAMLKACGNAVVPQQAYLILAAIASRIESSSVCGFMIGGSAQ